MNLKEVWGTKVWNRATTECLIQDRLSDASGGQIEELQEQIRILKEIIANIIDSMPVSDKKKLEIVALYGWELVE